MSTATSPFCQALTNRPSVPSTTRSLYKLHKPNTSLNRTNSISFSSFSSSSRFSRTNWRYSCFKDENSFKDYNIPETSGDTLPEEALGAEPNQANAKHHWFSSLKEAVNAILSAEPWTVPWTAKTILQGKCFHSMEPNKEQYL